MTIKKFKVNASKQAKSIKKRIIASELLSGIDKLPERGKVITKTIKGDPVVIVGIGDNKYMYKSYLNKASASGDVQFIRNLIKKGEVPANAVKNLGYKLYTSSGSVESACGKKSVKSGKVAASKKFTAKAAKSIKAARNSKTIVELVLQGNYGYGWDDLVSYDNTPEGRKEMKDDLKTYQQEEGGRASFRTIERRVANPDYKAPADRFRVTPYKLGFKYKDGDTVKFTDMEEAIEYATSQDKDVVLKDAVTGYNVQISNDTSFGMSGQERDNFNKRNIRNFRQVVGESETVESSMSAKKQFSVTAAIAGDLTNKDKRSIKTIIDKFFTNDGKSYKSGNWRISAGGYDLVAELYEQDIPVCGILYFAGVYTVESYGYDADDTSKYVADILSDVVSVGVISNEVELKLSTVESTVSAKKFGIKASKSAKRRKAIKASGIQNDIVMYFNGDNVYQGSVYDLADAVENLCYDDEVNAKFQEWCNQFGDPFDFDGSPIDTARVFTDIIIHEAEESPVSEDGQSEFYEDGDGILDFEIFYADEFSIDGAKSIKCSSSDNYNDLDEAMRFRVCNYYDTKFRDLAECKVFDDFDEAVDYAHECLGKGPTTIEDYYVGTVEIDPDEYWDNFDGEFWCTPELANFRDEVWKSMGIGASKSIKCNDGIAPDDYDSVEDLVPEAYALSGGEDGDMLEYVDDYIATEGCPATVNFVTYNTPNDWSVDVSKYGKDVVSDFIWYLEEVASDLSDKFYDYPSYEDDTTRNAFKGTKYEEGGKYATFYGDNALAANDYEFQFYPAQNQWSAPQIEFDTDELKLIGFTDGEIDELIQIYEDYKTAWIKNCKYINAHISEFLANLESNVNASTNIEAGWKSMGIGASTGITAALNKKSDINDEQYNQALADEVADMLRADGFEDIEVSVAPEAISFFINDEVMFVQPTNMITPNMADIYDDCTELFNAVKEATTDKMWKLYDEENKAMRDAWEDPDIEDPDYATRAVTLSRKAKGKDISAAEETIDIDDLDYISGDDEQEDWGYGFDSNGDPIDESTVDELCRIANEILEKSELVKQYDEYASIDRDTFDYYMSSPHVNEKFYIYFTFTKDGQWLLDNGFVEFGDSWVGWNVAEDYTFECDILVENGEVKDILYNDMPDNHSAELIDMPAVTEFIEKLASGVAMDIYNGTTNL